MAHALLDLASRFGYLIVFLGVAVESMGIPVPGETSLLVGAVLAAQGHLSAPGVAAAGWAGAVAGDNCGYLIGRRYGARFMALPLLRRVYEPHRVAAAERFFEGHGWTAVFFGRFVALLRILAGPLAGMHRMPWPRFLVANAAGGACWVAAVVTAGILIGNNLDRADRLVSDAGWVALGVVLALLGIAAAVWRRRLRRERRAGDAARS